MPTATRRWYSHPRLWMLLVWFHFVRGSTCLISLCSGFGLNTIQIKLCKPEKRSKSNCANLKKLSRSNRAMLNTFKTYCLSQTKKDANLWIGWSFANHPNQHTANICCLHFELRYDETVAAEICADRKNGSNQIAQTWKQSKSSCANLEKTQINLRSPENCILHILTKAVPMMTPLGQSIVQVNNRLSWKHWAWQEN